MGCGASAPTRLPEIVFATFQRHATDDAIPKVRPGTYPLSALRWAPIAASRLRQVA